MTKNLLNLTLFFLSLNFSFAQGESCVNPIDLDPFIPDNGNGVEQIAVDNTTSSQFFKYTATQVGIIEMSSAFSNAPGDPNFDTWLRVYDSNCNLIFDEDDTPGLLGGVEFRTEVEIGDTYIFEWAYVEWGGTFNVEFIYHIPVTGIECNTPDALALGNNLADNWFGAKYYTYTATQDGTLTISTCEHPLALYRNTSIINICNGDNLANIDYTCDVEDEDRHTATYNISNGETVTIKMEGYIHMHYDYEFTASFEASVALSNEEFSLNEFSLFPNPFVEALFIKTKNESEIKNINFYDVTGKAIPFSWNIDHGNVTKIIPQGINNGVYFLKINDTTIKVFKK